MTLHYSANFQETQNTFHGEVNYPLEIFQTDEKYTKSMTAFCRKALTTSCEKWGFDPADLIKAEFYFYRGSEEIIFFSWEKETVNNEET